MKRYICLCLIFVLLFSACSGSSSKDTAQIKIGIVVYNENDTFISLLMDEFMEGVTRETKNGRSISVIRYSAGGDQTHENEQVEEMISRGCNVLCVNLVDRTDPSMIIEMARKADVPVVFFNRELVEKDLNSWDKLYYVGADAFDSGIIQGQIAADAWNGVLDTAEIGNMDKNGDGILQYAILEGEAGHQDAIVRTEYSVNTIVEAGIQVEKCDSAIANWNRPQAQAKMVPMINQFGNTIELVLGNNDDMALGAIDEYDKREIPMEERPVIIGIDGTGVGLAAVKEGKMLGTVYNDKEEQAAAMLNLAIYAVTGEDFENIKLVDGKYIRYPYVRITNNNIDEYMEE